MTRQTLDQELLRLRDEVLVLGDMVETALVDSVRCLKRQNLEESRRLIAADKHINEKRFAVEADVLVLLATQHPMARDLRFLAAVLEVITELERMGDYAKGIARINLMIDGERLVGPLVDICAMAKKAQGMLHRALEAFVEQDVELAWAIARSGGEMDRFYEKLNRELMARFASNPLHGQRVSHLIWVLHNLQRLGDRVVNLCERVIFAVTGEMVELGTADRSLSPSIEG